jgi:hypothetical protein
MENFSPFLQITQFLKETDRYFLFSEDAVVVVAAADGWNV